MQLLVTAASCSTRTCPCGLHPGFNLKGWRAVAALMCLTPAAPALACLELGVGDPPGCRVRLRHQLQACKCLSHLPASKHIARHLWATCVCIYIYTYIHTYIYIYMYIYIYTSVVAYSPVFLSHELSCLWPTHPSDNIDNIQGGSCPRLELCCTSCA